MRGAVDNNARNLFICFEGVCFSLSDMRGWSAGVSGPGCRPEMKGAGFKVPLVWLTFVGGDLI
jgi:hypothetical protein